MAARIWLLAAEIGGCRLLCSTEPAAPVATLGAEGWAAGDLLAHEPVLAVPMVSWRAIPGASTVGEQSVSTSLLLPSNLSLCELEAQGQNVARAPVELALWTPGTAYEARQVVARGWMEIDSYPLGGESLNVAILSPEPTSTATIPPVGDEISDATLNPYTIVSGGASIGFSMPDDVAGLAYPFPIGRPGKWIDELGAAVDVPSTPARLITQTAASQRVLVGARQVGATTMTIHNADPEGVATTTYAGVISYIYDGRGQVLATVDVSAVGSWFLDGREDLYCTGWTDGIVLDGSTRVRGLGDAILFLLRLAEADGTYDLGRWEAARAALNTIEIGGYIDTSILPWEVVTKDLLSLFPRCVVMPGPAGLYPVIFDETSPDECIELIEGIDFELAANVRPMPATDGGVSSVRVEYALHAVSESYLGTVTLGPRTDNQQESGHSAARRAWGWNQGLAAGRDETVIESPWIWQHATAARVADDVLRLGSERLPSLVLQMLDAERWKSLPLGLSVRVTSTTCAWSKRACWVCGATLGALDEIEVLARPR